MRRRWDFKDYALPAPPVCTAKWDAKSWLRFARQEGLIARKGPAPSVVVNGRAFKFSGYVDGTFANYGPETFETLFGR
jgi:hypothetical protein